MGSGSFNICIDSEKVLTSAQSLKDQFSYDYDMAEDDMFLSPSGAMTPVQAESERHMNELVGTSYYQPNCSAHTPGYQQGSFSPGDQYGSPAFYASPAHFASPGYHSPMAMAGASPIYNMV